MNEETTKTGLLAEMVPEARWRARMSHHREEASTL